MMTNLSVAISTITEDHGVRGRSTTQGHVLPQHHVYQGESRVRTLVRGTSGQ